MSFKIIKVTEDVLKTLPVTNISISSLPGVDTLSDYIINLVKSVVLKSMGGIGQICIIVCGMSIMWFMLNNDSRIARDGAGGSIIIYIGTKIVEVWLK